MQTDDLLVKFYSDRVEGRLDVSIAELCERYLKEFLPTKDIKESTKYHEVNRINRLKEDLKTESVYDFTVRSAAEYLDKNFTKNSYVKHRGSLRELFDFAKRKGLYDKENPVSATESKTKQSNIKIRQRMTLQQYKELHAAAPDWLKNAMDFSLITLQGRSEVVSAKFADIDEEKKTIRIIRKKTDKHEWAFLELEISPQLDEVIKRCRASNIASPFIIHRQPERINPDKSKEHWSQILPNFLSKGVNETRAELSSFKNLEKEEMPSFHEIRSLGSYLYSKAGFNNEEYVQPLMAHADVEMTKKYQSGHQITWTKVRADLDIKSILKS
jgi:integrase